MVVWVGRERRWEVEWDDGGLGVCLGGTGRGWERR